MANYLKDFWKSRASKLPAGHSGGELRYVNWNPKAAVDGLSCPETVPEPSSHLPTDFVGTDMRALMERLRALASQI